jgi:hypothetical protein
MTLRADVDIAKELSTLHARIMGQYLLCGDMRTGGTAGTSFSVCLPLTGGEPGLDLLRPLAPRQDEACPQQEGAAGEDDDAAVRSRRQPRQRARIACECT